MEKKDPYQVNTFKKQIIHVAHHIDGLLRKNLQGGLLFICIILFLTIISYCWSFEQKYKKLFIFIMLFMILQY